MFPFRKTADVTILALLGFFCFAPDSRAQGWLGSLFGRNNNDADRNNRAATVERGGAGAASLRQRQVDFLVQLRRSDPQRATIEKAIFNERNELGLILAHGVPMDSVSKLARAVLIQMARAFPGQDLTVLVYAPSNPPLKIGTGRLNARTRDMTFEAARR